MQGGGALIKSVTAGGPASRAGVYAGDVVKCTECGDNRTRVDVNKPSDVFMACAKAKPGEPVTLHIDRATPGSFDAQSQKVRVQQSFARMLSYMCHASHSCW